MSSGKDARSLLPKKRLKSEDLEEDPEEPILAEAILGDQDSDSDLSETWSEFGETLFNSTAPNDPGEESDEDEPYHEPEESEEDCEPPPDHEEPMDEPEVKIPQKIVQPRKKLGKKSRTAKRFKKLQHPKIKPEIYEEFPHVCSICTRRFYLEKHLHSHLEKHQQTPTCPACPNSIKFSTMSDLKDHILSCPSLPAFVGSIDLVQRPYICIEPNCFKSYARKDSHLIHLGQPHSPNSQISARINKMYQRPSTSDDPKPYKCVQCGAAYKWSKSLNIHVRSVHLLIKFKCTFPGCDKTLADKGSFNKHIKYHVEGVYHKRAICKYPGCEKSLSDSSALKRHMNTHMNPSQRPIIPRRSSHSTKDGPRPYICDECGATYKSSHGLYLHVKSVHLKIRYKCTYPGCDASLSGKSALNTHIKGCHSNKDVERPYICEHCGCSYKGSQGLSYHMKSRHLNLKFQCIFPGCDKKFSQKNYLRIHLRSFHNGEGLSNQDASNIVSEIQGQSTSEPRNAPEKLVCQYCGLLYSQKSMRVHQRVKHFDSLSPEEQAKALSQKVLDESKGRLVSKNTIYIKKKKLMSQEELRAARERRIRREGLQMAGETLDDTIARLDHEKEERERMRKEELRAKRAAETEEEREARRAKYREYQKQYIERNRDKLYEKLKNYHKKRYQNITPEEKAARAARFNEYQRRRWAMMTPEQKRWKNRKKSKDFGQN